MAFGIFAIVKPSHPKLLLATKPDFIRYTAAWLAPACLRYRSLISNQPSPSRSTPLGTPGQTGQPQMLLHLRLEAGRSLPISLSDSASQLHGESNLLRVSSMCLDTPAPMYPTTALLTHPSMPSVTPSNLSPADRGTRDTSSCTSHR